jgi:hypothetical protein
MAVTVSDALLSDALNYLDITWDDIDTNRKVSGILARGMAFLDRIAGTPQDYEAEDLARSLLFDYARYARENVTQDFVSNYLTELNSLRMYCEGEAAMCESDGEGDA